jgi:hypothetical protein
VEKLPRVRSRQSIPVEKIATGSKQTIHYKEKTVSIFGTDQPLHRKGCLCFQDKQSICILSVKLNIIH